MKYLLVEFADTVDLSGTPIDSAVTVSGKSGKVVFTGQASNPTVAAPALVPHTHNLVASTNVAQPTATTTGTTGPAVP